MNSDNNNNDDDNDLEMHEHDADSDDVGPDDARHNEASVSPFFKTRRSFLRAHTATHALPTLPTTLIGPGIRTSPHVSVGISTPPTISAISTPPIISAISTPPIISAAHETGRAASPIEPTSIDAILRAPHKSVVSTLHHRLLTPSKPNKIPITDRVRWHICGRQAVKCAFCNHTIRTLYESFEIDHIVPRHLGGSNDLENLQMLHHACHKRKTEIEQQARADINYENRHGLSRYFQPMCTVFYRRVPLPSAGVRSFLAHENPWWRNLCQRYSVESACRLIYASGLPLTAIH